jgi:hypothetical protein
MAGLAAGPTAYVSSRRSDVPAPETSVAEAILVMPGTGRPITDALIKRKKKRQLARPGAVLTR